MKQFLLSLCLILTNVTAWAQTDAQSKSQNNSKVILANASDPILPKWMQQQMIGRWIGAAPPTPDMQRGRNIAIINAALAYLRSQQMGKMKSIANSKNKYTKVESADTFMSSSLIEYSGFAIEVSDEYYNSRGEYFVRCNFRTDKQSTNKLSLLKKQSYASQNKNGKEFMQMAAEVKIKLTLNDQPFSCILSCSSMDNKQAVCQITVDDIPLKPSTNLTYENMPWQQEHSSCSPLSFTKEEVAQSLGILQMATYTLIPFIPRTLTSNSHVVSKEMSTESGEYMEMDILSNSQCFSDTLCLPTEITPMSLSANKFAMNIHDTNMADVDVNRYYDFTDDTPRDVVIHYNYCQVQQGGLIPLLLANNLFIGSIIVNASQINTKIESTSRTTISEFDTNSSEPINQSISQTKLTLQNIGIRWNCLGGNSKGKGNKTKIEPYFGCYVKTGAKPIY